jgi:dolichol-phosphate mannosyltransferase
VRVVTLSIVTPVFNEAGNLDALHARLRSSLERLGVSWEWVIVDDHSRDDTAAVVARLAAADPRVRGIRLARNSGSHVAISCGLHQARGAVAIVLAGDLQDPPELVERMLDAWRSGARVVWGVRRAKPDAWGRFYYWMMRRLAGMPEIPANGADCFLADRVVLDAFRECRERHVSVFALVTWLGFQHAYVEYDKDARASGRSGWTLTRKIDLVINSVAGFSDFPIRACGALGIALVAAGVLLALTAVFGRWDAGPGVLLIVATMVGLTGLQLTAAAVVGAYVWRALEEARRRPQYVIERVIDAAAATGPPGAEPLR